MSTLSATRATQNTALRSCLHTVHVMSVFRVHTRTHVAQVCKQCHAIFLANCVGLLYRVHILQHSVFGGCLRLPGKTRNTPKTTGHICRQPGLIVTLGQDSKYTSKYTISSISINTKCSRFYFNSRKTKFSLAQQLSQMHGTICGTKCTLTFMLKVAQLKTF